MVRICRLADCTRRDAAKNDLRSHPTARARRPRILLHGLLGARYGPQHCRFIAAHPPRLRVDRIHHAPVRWPRCDPVSTSARVISMETNSDLRLTVNELIQTCRDGQEGFLTAAQNVDDPEAKKLFNEFSLQRAKFTGDLQTASHLLGDSNPENASSIGGVLHRGWINLKTAVAGRDTHGILLECERGEASAAAQYEKVLELDLPADLRELIERQGRAIQAAHDRVKELRDATPPG